MNPVSVVMNLAVMPALAFDGREPPDPRAALIVAVDFPVPRNHRAQDGELLKIGAKARPERIPAAGGIINPEHVCQERDHFFPPLISTAFLALALPRLAASQRASCLARSRALRRSSSSSLAIRRTAYPRAAGPGPGPRSSCR